MSGGRKINVLRDVTFAAHAGDSVSIRGESGCGKTTLLNIIAGLENADSGEVCWDGLSLNEQTASALASLRSRAVGMVFQTYTLVAELNVLENVYLACRIKGSMGAAQRKRAHELLERVGLNERLKSNPLQLSGGERQRVALARALMNAPSLVLADEPTGNLDEATSESVMKMLLETCDDLKTCLILITHNPQFAARCQHQYLLKDGALHPATE